MIVGHIGGGGESVIDTGDIQKSLRFAASRSTYLSRVDANNSTSSRATFSCWLKRGAVSTDLHALHTVTYDVNNRYLLSLDTGGVTLYGISGGVTAYYKTSGNLLRDPSSHFHILAVYDSTLAVAEDRVKLFINGSRITSFPVTNINPAQNAVIWQSSTVWAHRIGQDFTAGYYLDGYLSRTCFVDGQALTPDSFGYLNTEINEWVTKSQSAVKAVVDAGGTNSFMLDFDDGTSLTTLGYDKSAKGNNWTLNNHSLTAGATYDWMLDVPGNSYCRFSPIDKSAASNHDWSSSIITSSAASVPALTRGTIGVSSGKWYWEGTVNNATTDFYHGIQTNNASLTAQAVGSVHVNHAGQCYVDGALVATFSGSAAQGDVISVALDLDGGTVSWYRNNVLWGSRSLGANTWFPVTGNFSTASAQGINFGQRPFAYTPPTGFKALCQANLPDNGVVTVSGTFTGNAAADGPFVWANGVPKTLTINGNAVTFATHADKTAGGFKLRTALASYNTAGANTWTATIDSNLQNVFKYNNAQGNP